MQAIAEHEASLTAYTLERMRTIDGVELYGDANPHSVSARLGVIPFNVNGLSHFLVAAILGAEFGIGVRHGGFCAHPYLIHLMRISDAEGDQVRTEILARDRHNMPGLVRVSFGMYNTAEEVDALILALNKIARGDYSGKYAQDAGSGEYHAVGWSP